MREVVPPFGNLERNAFAFRRTAKAVRAGGVAFSWQMGGAERLRVPSDGEGRPLQGGRAHYVVCGSIASIPL